MAPTVKEPDQQSSSVSSSSASISQPRVQPVALEIAVTVNGARTAEGSDKREPFSETTQTVLVYGSGAVIRLNAGVTPGQLLFLTNEKTKKEVVCQVVKSKNYRSVSGYVELEFTEPAVGFWGMRFPTDRVVATPAATGNAAAPAKPAPVEQKPVLPAVQTKPAEPAAPPAPVVAATLTSPAGLKPEGPAAVASEAASIVTPAADNSTEELKKQTARLQEQLSSIVFEETPAPPPTPNKPILQLDAIAMSEATAKIFEMATPGTAASTTSAEALVEPPTKIANPTSPAMVARDNKPASFLQEAEPPTKIAEPTSLAPVDRNSKSASFLQEVEPSAKIFEPTTSAPVARSNNSASFLQEEEVKIPAWLEPLARNAANSTPVAATPVAPPAAPVTRSFTAPSAPLAPPAAPAVTEIVGHQPASAALEVTESEDAQVPVPNESYNFANVTEGEPIQARQTEAPNFGAGLFESNESVPAEPAQGGSKKGLWIGAIAATLLLAAGGGYWYMLMQGHATASTTEAATVSQPTPQPQFSTQPQQSPQNLASTSAPATDKTFSTPSQVNSQPLTKPAPAAAPAVDVQKIAGGHDSSKPVPNSAASRAAEPAAQPVEETRNPTFNKMRLAAPTVKGEKTQSISNEPEPGIALESEANSAPANLGSGLVGSKTNQPAAPIPIGGDVATVQLISSVPPVYPQIARTQRVSGEVKIDALIDENGRVTGMKVVSGPVMLHQAAMDALRQWKYKPATLNGKPVSMHLVVTIQFRLQ